MAGMEFEYDEQGGTFYYFLLSFLAFILFPATYYLWPSKPKSSDSDKKFECQCSRCQIKRQHLQSEKPWTTFKNTLIKLCLLIGWVFFIWVAYKASLVELDLEEFDPFKELEIDRGATDREIKKAYRKLSLIYHPDRETGDPKKFMRITKAHAALTDEEARKNWEEYGNPDGPGAMQFGIALPKWIVEKQNSIWVLAAYGLVFMIILPVAVGSWWYRSIKFSAEQILMDTMQLYRFFIHKTPNMVLKRTVMILAASFEYEKGHNNEIVNRPSDNEEIPMLMKELPYLQEKNKEPPLCSPYSVKARALLHAHFSRLDLPQKTLDIDRQYVVKKAPYLLNEMINISAVLVAWGHAGRTSRIPRLDTIENMMRVSQMVVQAVWDTKSSLLQLPHITDDMLRHFVTKKRNIRGIRDFVSMRDEDRMTMLRNLSGGEYQDIINVCASMPNIVMQHSVSVLDDEDSNVITAGAIVTVNVHLQRRSMAELFDRESAPQLAPNVLVETVQADDVSDSDQEADAEEKSEEHESPQLPRKQHKVWEKTNKKKKGGKSGAGKKKKQQQQYTTKTVVVKKTPAAAAATDDASAAAMTNAGSNQSTPKSVKKSKSAAGDDASSGGESGSEADSDDADNAVAAVDDDKDVDGKRDDDDDDWIKYQKDSKKELLDTKSKETHEVHAPYFPLVKQEWWWLYIGEKRSHSLITAPVQLCSLKNSEEVQLKFSAPPKPGKYRYSVFLRSDSYFQDFDQHQNFEIDVKEAKKVETHPQWDEVTDDEDDKNDASDSDVTDSDDESD